MTKTCTSDPGSGRTGFWYRHATQSQAHINSAGAIYNVSLILDTNPASIAAVDKAYQKKYTVDPSLPLLLTDQAHSTTSRLFPIADIGEEDWGSLGL